MANKADSIESRGVGNVDLTKIEGMGNGTDEAGIPMKINVDVSEALTGLKAVQREARKATQSLRELEGAYKSAKDIEVCLDGQKIGDILCT